MGPKCNHMHSCKREAEGDSHTRKMQCDREAETGVMWPQAKGSQQPPEAGRGQERFPCSLQKEHRPAHT